MSKKSIIFVFGLMLVTALGCGKSQAPTAPIAPAEQATPEVTATAPEPPPAATEFVIADFNSAERKNALGGEFGAWASADDQPVAKCADELIGGAWKISYDITNEGSYCWLWMKLNNLDGSQYKNLIIVVKGEGEFSSKFFVELKTDNGARVSRATVDGVTTDWKTITIPLSQFKELPSLQGLSELTTVFDNQIASVKKGTILIDTISLQ